MLGVAFHSKLSGIWFAARYRVAGLQLQALS